MTTYPPRAEALAALDMLAEPNLVSFDTSEVTPSKRLEYWQNSVRAGDGLKLLCSTSNFLAQIQSRDLGQFKIFGLKTHTPHRSVRTEALEDVCFVNLQRESDGVVFRGDHEMNMRPGSMTIYRASKGYEIDVPSGSSSIVLAMPMHQLERDVPNFGRHLEDALPYNPHLIDMLAGLCESVLSNSDPLRQTVVDGVSASVRHMLLAILNDTQSSSDFGPTVGQSAIINRIKSFVLENIADPELSPAKVAACTGITVSYLHKVYRQEQTTLMQFVFSARLERCRADIAKYGRSANVSQIAFSWGFNDASHFTRSFRKKFGLSPREYRKYVEEQALQYRPH